MRPPWSLRDEVRFVERCTRCGDCVRACPRGLLIAGDGGYPVLSFAQQGCDACGACSRACASGAIGAADGGPAFVWVAQAGDACLARRRVECRICGDNCPQGAWRFVLVPGGVAQPVLETATCNGCGECVAPCPVGAISMLAPNR
jgi:ferredoxin-type protein NapF